LTISLPESVTQLKEFLVHLDKAILDRITEIAKQYYKAILEEVDEALARYRGDKLQIEHKRAVWYRTCLGPVKISRREYLGRGGAGKGERRCLLDNLMGMDKHNHTTLQVQELALETASQMPYRRSAEVLRKTSGIDLPHQTIWRMVAKTADPYIAQERQELKWFMQSGEIPPGEGKQVSRLMVEADGVILSLQREKERRAEVKLGIAYEGWEKVGKDRYRTTNKTIFSTVGGRDQFWSGLSLKLQKTYDLSRIRDTVVGGDGAGWIKEGASYVNGRYQLDRYHLHKELCAAFGRDNQIKGRIWTACERGEVAIGLGIMAEALKKARGDDAIRIARAYRYLNENSSGVGDYRLGLGDEVKSLRHTGAIEGNIDKLIVRRMKNQGMSWTLMGIRRLLCVRFLVLEKKLTGWIENQRPPRTESIKAIPKRKVHRIVTRLSAQEPDEWIKAGLPALYGPHASRPWVKALKSLSEAFA
jgi:hypothetical protein